MLAESDVADAIDSFYFGETWFLGGGVTGIVASFFAGVGLLLTPRFPRFCSGSLILSRGVLAGGVLWCLIIWPVGNGIGWP